MCQTLSNLFVSFALLYENRHILIFLCFYIFFVFTNGFMGHHVYYMVDMLNFSVSIYLVLFILVEAQLLIMKTFQRAELFKIKYT